MSTLEVASVISGEQQEEMGDPAWRIDGDNVVLAMPTHSDDRLAH